MSKFLRYCLMLICLLTTTCSTSSDSLYSQGDGDFSNRRAPKDNVHIESGDYIKDDQKEEELKSAYDAVSIIDKARLEGDIAKARIITNPRKLRNIN